MKPVFYRAMETTGLRLASFPGFAGISSPGIVILAYHDIGVLPEPVPRRYIYNVSEQNFREQMMILRKMGIPVIPLREAVLRLQGELPLDRRYAVLTFDDGFHLLMKSAVPVLQELEFPATFFVATGFLDKEIFPWLADDFLPSGEVIPQWQPFTKEDIKSIAGNPQFEIGSHSHLHVQFEEGKFDKYLQDVKLSIDVLQAGFGINVESFAYPYSFPGQRKRAGSEFGHLENGFRHFGLQAICTTQMGLNRAAHPAHRLKRMQVKSYDSPALFRARLAGNLGIPEFIQRLSHKLF